MVKIYVLIDPFTSKVRYVGKTIMTLNRRLKCHIKCNSNKQKVKWLSQIIKNGSYPIIKQIDEIKIEEWCEAEKYWIKYYREMHGNLFNILDGGNSVMSGFKRKPHTEEFKKAVSIRQKGNLHRLGHKASLETILKKSESAKKAHKEGRMKNCIPLMNEKRKKPVIQYSKEGVFINEFKSVTEAAVYLGLKRNAITENTRGANRSCGGYIFKLK